MQKTLLAVALAGGMATGCLPPNHPRPRTAQAATARRESLAEKFKGFRYLLLDSQGCFGSIRERWVENQELKAALKQIEDLQRLAQDKQARLSRIPAAEMAGRLAATATEDDGPPVPPIQTVADKLELVQRCGSNLAVGCHIRKGSNQTIYIPGYPMAKKGFGEGTSLPEIIGHEIGHSRSRRVNNTDEKGVSTSPFEELEATVYGHRLIARWANGSDAWGGYRYLADSARHIRLELVPLTGFLSSIRGFSSFRGKFRDPDAVTLLNYRHMGEWYDDNYGKFGIKPEEKDESRRYMLADMMFAVLIGAFDYDLDRLYGFLHSSSDHEVEARIDRELSNGSDLTENLDRYEKTLENRIGDRLLPDFRRMVNDLAIVQMAASSLDGWKFYRIPGTDFTYATNRIYLALMQFTDDHTPVQIGLYPTGCAPSPLRFLYTVSGARVSIGRGTVDELGDLAWVQDEQISLDNVITEKHGRFTTVGLHYNGPEISPQHITAEGEARHAIRAYVEGMLDQERQQANAGTPQTPIR